MRVIPEGSRLTVDCILIQEGAVGSDWALIDESRSYIVVIVMQCVEEGKGLYHPFHWSRSEKFHASAV